SSTYWSLWRAPVPWYNRLRQVKDSSVVAVTVMWCARNFPEAPPALWQVRAEDGQLEPVRDHPMLRLLKKPNSHYSGTLLWMATVTDWKMSGNAYWLKIRNQIGAVVELWWIPSWMVEPVGDPDDDSVFIAAYIYTPTDVPLRIDPADIVHFRFGLDDENPRKGCSPLRSVLREVFTDDEAARFTATILVNGGVPGVIVSPDPAVKVSDDDIQKAKRDIDEQFTGPRRGAPMVMKGATKVNQFGFSPQQLVLTELRRVPEERVTSAIGVPAIVVGLGAGLQHSTFTNMGEAQAYAYSNGLIPDQRLIADAVQWQLLTDFMSEDDVWAHEFGLEVVDDRDTVYLRPMNYTQVNAQGLDAGKTITLRSQTPVDPAEAGAPPSDRNAPPAPQTAPANPNDPGQNGANGHGDDRLVAALIGAGGDQDE